MANSKNENENRRTMTVSEYNAANPNAQWGADTKVAFSYGGKTYALTNKQYDWITSRYKNDWAGSYGHDLEDQRAQAEGRMSSSVYNSYKNNGIDYQLRNLGLPSIKNLEKYLGYYDQWHTGGIDDVFGKNVSADAWTKVKELYKNDWKYDDTTEDKMRKKRGLMPSSLASKYTDTEIDEQLKASGLPSLGMAQKYFDRYNNYTGIDALYKNVAMDWANLRLSGIKNDGNTYANEDGTVEKTGEEWYADAFFDELERKDNNGKSVYGSILPLFKPRTTTKEADPTKDYVSERGRLITAGNKSAALDDDYANYTAFSYDDFDRQFGDYYDKYLKDYKLSSGQTVDEAISVLARQENEKAEKEFYTVPSKKDAQDFVFRYERDYPTATPEKMFDDMFEHGVEEKVIKAAKRELEKQPGADKNAINASYAASLNKHKAKTIETTVMSQLIVHNAALREGGLTPENIQASADVLKANGQSSPEAVDKAVESVMEKQTEQAAEQEKVESVKASSKAMNAYIDQSIKDNADEETVALAYNAIEKAMQTYMDPDEGTVSPEDVIKVINSIEEQSWNNPTAMRIALEDFGFGDGEDLSGPAAMLSIDWTPAEIRKVVNSIGPTRYNGVELSDELLARMNNSMNTEISDAEAFYSRENQKTLDKERFDYALEWAQQQIQSGAMNEFDAYNILAMNGFQEELKEFVGKDWYKSIYAHERVAEAYQREGGDKLAYYEGLTDEEKYNLGLQAWDALGEEGQQEAFKDYDWMFDPSIYRTGKQAFQQQFAAIIPGLAANLVSSPIKYADMITANLSGREEMWDVTKKLTAGENLVAAYGAVNDRLGNGVQVASVAADVTQELARMYILGSIGGQVGEAFGSTKLGQVLNAINNSNTARRGVKALTKVFTSIVNASPFVVSATASNYAEAKTMGASTSAATGYAVVMGTLEGVWESFEFDNMWGKVFGADKFGKEILESGASFKNLLPVAKARIANMVISGLGEWTEEFLGYTAESLWKMSTEWGKDERWNAADALQQANMGFLTGFFGAGLRAGSITKDQIIRDYLSGSQEVQNAVQETGMGTLVWDNASEAQRASWRSGELRVRSLGEFSDLVGQMAVCANTPAKANDEYEKTIAKINKKYGNATAEANAKGAKATTERTGEAALKFSTAFANMTNEQVLAAAERYEAGVKRDNTIRNAEKQLKDLKRQFQEHYAALYLQNESQLQNANIQPVAQNVSADMQNGATVSPETVAEANAEAATEAPATAPLTEAEAALPWVSKQDVAESRAARPFTDADEQGVVEAAKKVGYKGNVSFVDDPNVGWEGRITSDGNIEINRAKLTARDTQRLQDNPAMWVLEHELWHHIARDGGDASRALATTVRKIYEKHPGLARGDVSANWTKFLNKVMEQRQAMGVPVNNIADAEEEVIADFFRNYAFRSDSAIKMLCDANGNLGQRILSWLRYKIDDMKLRRSKDSWARDILNVERQYALALREANKNAKATTQQQDSTVATMQETSANTAQAVDSTPQEGYNNTTIEEGMTNGAETQAEAGGDAGVPGQVVSSGDTTVQGRGDEGRGDSVLARGDVVERLAQRNIAAVQMDEVPSQQFYDAIGEAKAANSHGAFVDQHGVTEYDGMKTFTNADGSVGVAVTGDGDIVSVFKNTARSRDRGAVTSLLFKALENGGKKLDNFNSPALSGFYLQHGFVPVARIKFNDDYAPDGWNFERDGRPDILFWVHNGDSVDTILDKMGTYEMPDVESLPLFEGENAYDEARDYRDGLVGEDAGWTNTKAETQTEEAAPVAEAQTAEPVAQETVEAPVEEAPAPVQETAAQQAEAQAQPAETPARPRTVRRYGEVTGTRGAIQGTTFEGGNLAVADVAYKIGKQKRYAHSLRTGRPADYGRFGNVSYSGHKIGDTYGYSKTVYTTDSFGRSIQDGQSMLSSVSDLTGPAFVDDVVRFDFLPTEDLGRARNMRERDVIGRAPANINPADVLTETQRSELASVGEALANGNEVVVQLPASDDFDGKVRAALQTIFDAVPDSQKVNVSFATGLTSNDIANRGNGVSLIITDASQAQTGNDGKTWVAISGGEVQHSTAGNVTDNALKSFSNESNISDATTSSVSPEEASGSRDIQYSGSLDVGKILNDMGGDGDGSTTSSAADALVQQYGAKQQGRQPRARDIQVPERVSAERRVSDLARNVIESNKLTDAQAKEFLDDIADGAFLSYIPETDQHLIDEARAYITRRQTLDAQQDFHDMVEHRKFNKETNALGIQLLADAAARGDVASVKSIITDLQTAATEVGQSVQIFNVLKQLKGVGSAWYMEGLVKKLNKQYDDRIKSGKMQPITVSPALMDNLSRATTIDEIAAAEEAVAKDIAQQLPLTWVDRLSNWRYFSMLANPTTHFRNMTGNLFMKGMNAASDVVATGIERAFVKDESQRGHALLTSDDKAKWGAFADQSYAEQASNLRGGGKQGFASFVKQNMRDFDTKLLNRLSKWNSELLEKEDITFIKPAYKDALMQYMKAQGYTLNDEGKAGKVDAKGVFHEMTNGQMTAAVEWASTKAWEATFREANKISTWLNKMSQEFGPVGRMVVEGLMPFKKTPVNIARTGAKFSPLGIMLGAKQLMVDVKQGKMSAAKAVDNISHGITGSALMAFGALLAKLGFIRVGEDKKKLETYLEDTGDQTYAFKVGDVSVNMSAIAPATIPLFMGVALQESASRNGEDLDLSALADTLAGTLNPFMEMSFMSSLNNALKSYGNNGVGGAVGSFVSNALQSYGSQYLPTLGGKIAQFADPTRRSTKSDATSPIGGTLDYYGRSLAKKVPGLEATLEPDVDVWGRETTKGNPLTADGFFDWALDFANKFILPMNVKVANRDAVDRELIRIVESTGNTDFLPSDGNKYFTVNKKKYKMNAKQYTEYSQERGQASYAALKEVMRSAAYRNASDEARADMLTKALKAAHKQVDTRWKDILGAFD